MRNNRWRGLLVLTLFAVGLVGCQKEKVGDIKVNAGESAIYIDEEGAVSYAISEDFDKNYYDKDDLKEMIQNEIDEYNAGPYSASIESAELDAFRVKDDVVTTILSFQSIDDFIGYEKAYNGKGDDEIFIGRIEDALEQDFEISGDFTEVENGAAGAEGIAAAKIQNLDENIIIMKEKMLVQIAGTVEYMSSNCTVAEGIVTITDDEPAYIVYKDAAK